MVTVGVAAHPVLDEAYGTEQSVRQLTGVTFVVVDARVMRTHDDVLHHGLALLVADGSAAVTHARLAREAGYARATLYAHWPTREDLLRAVLSRRGPLAHRVPTGDLRADLAGELRTLRDSLLRQRLDRVVAVLVDLAATKPTLVPVRDAFTADLERGIRALLAPALTGGRLEAATAGLCGAVLRPVLHGTRPSDAALRTAVDLLLAGLDPVGTLDADTRADRK